MSEKKIRVNELLDMATKVAVLARLNGKVKSTQISNLLSVLEAEQGKDAIYLLLAHIIRQSQRVWEETTISSHLIRDLQLIQQKYKHDENELIAVTKEYLGLIKWIFDSLEVFEDRKKKKDKESEKKKERILRSINTFENLLDAYLRIGGVVNE